jgi:hypothetical protein
VGPEALSAVIHTLKEHGRKAGKPSDSSHSPCGPAADVVRMMRQRAGLAGHHPAQ